VGTTITMKAVTLAGGLGSRLSEEMVERPKPLVESVGKPTLWHIMKLYSAHGINEFVICLGYKGYLIKEYFANYHLHTCDVTFVLAAATTEVQRSETEPWRVTLVDRRLGPAGRARGGLGRPPLGAFAARTHDRRSRRLASERLASRRDGRLIGADGLRQTTSSGQLASANLGSLVPTAPATPTGPLRIGIDARAAAEVPAGRGRVVRELLRELAVRDDATRYRLYARTAWGSLDERFEWVLIPHNDPWWNLAASRRASRECDVFLSSNSYLTTWFATVPTVAIAYDLIAFDTAMKPNQRSAIIERLTLQVATWRCRAWIAISATTADALSARYPRCADRTWVALLGASSELDRAAAAHRHDPSLPEPGFVLAVGTLEPRKNLPRLVEAYRTLPDELQARHRLVVVGAVGWETGETLTALRSLGDRAELLGHVSDAALGELYRRCAVFCYPSLGEGFGLPVLEAMAAGAAVVTSNISSLPEVGGDAVEYADPRDVASIRAAIRRLLEDEALRRELGQRAIERAAGFSWAAFAARTLAVVEYAAGRAVQPPA